MIGQLRWSRHPTISSDSQVTSESTDDSVAKLVTEILRAYHFEMVSEQGWRGRYQLSEGDRRRGI